MATKKWLEIRERRKDLTDYVIHFTRMSEDGRVFPIGVLNTILREKHIRPSFAAMANRHSQGVEKNTIKGPDRAVCLTETPIWAIVLTREVFPDHYSGYGIAYHKWNLHQVGGRPVIYGTMDLLGTKLGPGDEEYVEGCQVYRGGLPREHQYLWAMYDPHDPLSDMPNVDFTWEREWRIKMRDPGLPILLQNDWKKTPRGMIVVERDHDIANIRKQLEELEDARDSEMDWARFIRIISLETAKRKVFEENDWRYSRLDTWPHDEKPRQ